METVPPAGTEQTPATAGRTVADALIQVPTGLLFKSVSPSVYHFQQLTDIWRWHGPRGFAIRLGSHPVD